MNWAIWTDSFPVASWVLDRSQGPQILLTGIKLALFYAALQGLTFEPNGRK